MLISLAGWHIDYAARTAQKGGVIRRLSPRAVKLLQTLEEADGAVVDRCTLLNLIWPNVFVSDESLTQVVAEIRRSLGDKGLIETINRSGYRLTQRAELALPTSAIGVANQNEPPVDLRALALCMEAKREIVRCGCGSMQRAEELTAEAIDLAPNFAGAHAERAIALVRSHLYWSAGRNLLPHAIAEAERAVALDPKLAAGHSALGYAYSAAGHWVAAERAHRQALAADPNSAACYHHAAWYLMSRQMHGPAITYFEQVGDLEPLNIKGYLHAAQLCHRNDPVRSRRNARRALRRAHTRLDDDPEDLRALTAIPVLMALLGEPGAAYSAAQDINVSGSAQAIYLASTLSMIGESERAIVTFEELFDHGWRDSHWLYTDPAFNPIFGDRRFRRLCRGLAAA